MLQLVHGNHCNPVPCTCPRPTCILIPHCARSTQVRGRRVDTVWPYLPQTDGMPAIAKTGWGGSVSMGHAWLLQKQYHESTAHSALAWTTQQKIAMILKSPNPTWTRKELLSQMTSRASPYLPKMELERMPISRLYLQACVCRMPQRTQSYAMLATSRFCQV